MTKEEILKSIKEKFEAEVNAYTKTVQEMIEKKELNIHTLDKVTGMSIGNIINGYKEACSLYMDAVGEDEREPNCKDCGKRMKKVKKIKPPTLCSHLVQLRQNETTTFAETVEKE